MGCFGSDGIGAAVVATDEGVVPWLIVLYFDGCCRLFSEACQKHRAFSQPMCHIDFNLFTIFYWHEVSLAVLWF
jgi:hypothetical protein